MTAVMSSPNLDKFYPFIIFFENALKSKGHVSAFLIDVLLTIPDVFTAFIKHIILIIFLMF